MLSFHNDQVVKDYHIARVRAHIKDYHLVRGVGWDGKKGGAIGCTLENCSCSGYPIKLGLPIWLALVEERLFEGMNAENSRTWPLDFLEAIPIGVSEERFEKEVKAPFLIIILKRLLEVVDLEYFPGVKSAINVSIAVWERDDIRSESWKEAASTAYNAVHVVYLARVEEAEAFLSEAEARGERKEALIAMSLATGVESVAAYAAEAACSPYALYATEEAVHRATRTEGKASVTAAAA